MMIFVKRALAIVLLSCCMLAVSSQYAMYVWTTGFDNTVSGCGEAELLAWNSGGPSFTHTWNTQEKRTWLWTTANFQGREIRAIFLSGVHLILKYAYDNQNCNTADVALVKQMLVEGHAQVPNLKIYGLFAVDDLAVSEKDQVKYIVRYNDVCASNASERFDGVAVNNEQYRNLKCGDMTARQTYLDNLEKIATEADKQVQGTLLTHYSMSWHWARCSGVTVNTTWKGVDKEVHKHMIDIFDSVDVQVGYIIHPAVSDRTKGAGYDYAPDPEQTYLYYPLFKQSMQFSNKMGFMKCALCMTARCTVIRVDPCQITFFPADTCMIPGHNETTMFQLFDAFGANGIGLAGPCIHYFRGVYSTGVVAAWPKHA